MRQASHVALPTVITGAGKYKTRGGETVVVESLTRWTAYGHYPNGVRERWDKSGRTLPFTENQNDIVETEHTDVK